jgi:hypothetical protein
MQAVITTINKPNKIYSHLSKLLGESSIIIVGDKKTPKEWEGVKGYLSLNEQFKLFPDLAEALPMDHYCRKNIGYLQAISKNSESIYETDDDTYLLGDEIDLAKISKTVKVLDSGWTNIYNFYSSQEIWPRGLPIECIEKKYKIKALENKQQPAVIQYLVNGDPDVDALYRLIKKLPISFDLNLNTAIELGEGSLCPFNSQNTIHAKNAYPFLYLPAYVSFRMTDIWRSIIAQIYLTNKGEVIQFRPPNSLQDRNDHDLIKDLQQEFDGYKYNNIIAGICQDSTHLDNPIDYLKDVYKRLEKKDIIKKQELQLLDIWCEYINEYFYL